MTLILSQLKYLFDGDPTTVPSETQIGAGLALMGLGWNTKSATLSGLPPTKGGTNGSATPVDATSPK